MDYFMHTTETIPAGVGFSHFDGLHLSWLAVFAVTVIVNCILFRKLDEKGKKRWQRTIACLIVLDEIFKDVMLIAGGRYEVDYLPLHLCSINIFTILLHTYRPSKLLDNFLYTICIPGAMAALLFPSWTKLPFGNFMHLHSSTIHILLAMYPIVLAVNGRLQISWKMNPKCLGVLLLMAIPIYGINMLLGTNFMFLTEADKGNPLYWFGQNWGNHLLGFPVLIAAVLIVMYLPLELVRKLRKTAV